MKNREAAYNTHIPDVCPFQERLFYRKSCKIIHLNPDTSITYFWIGYRECHAKSVILHFSLGCYLLISLQLLCRKKKMHSLEMQHICAVYHLF